MYKQTLQPEYIYGNDPSKPLTYKAPDPLLLSPVSVPQDTTIETHSKGKQTFPLKVHYPNLVFPSKIIPNTIGNVLELREKELRRGTSYWNAASTKGKSQ